MLGIVKRRLGDMLVESGKITPSELHNALGIQRKTGKKLGEVLIEQRLVTHEVIVEVLEEQTGIKKIDLSTVEVDKKVIKIIPENMCLKYILFPFAFHDNKISVAMWDPLNIFAVDDVSIASGFEVESYIGTKDQIKLFIERYYSNEQVLKAAEELSKEKLVEAKELDEGDIELDNIKNAPVVKMVDYLIKDALESRASDIHIEPYEEFIRIRYRIDGRLQEVSTLSIDTLPALITRIKILANLNIAEKRIPQDGRIITKVAGKDLDLRISILPIAAGEKVVIRVLNRDNYSISKAQLGLEEEDLKKLERIIGSPHGIVLVTGPTGSGKSTTLYTILNEINQVDRNIITIEDPVEYMIQGINQVNVNVKAGLTFAAGLRSILRQDPDVVMIGEIRDGETAQIAVRAAITGHLVFSTLHTNDAPSSILRLVDMGVEPFLVSTSISGVIAQRLVRRICPKCKETCEASLREKAILNHPQDSPLILHRGKGCANCNHSGYYGRRGVYEIMEITQQHKELILDNSGNNALKEFSVENGMKTIAMACKELVLKGETTIEELLNVTFAV